jgi:hypothetical protein
MATIVCPNCGHEQEDGMKCETCSSLFAYHEEPEQPDPGRSFEPPPRHSGALVNHPAVEERRGASFVEVLRLAYRVIQWSSLAILLVTVVLVLRKSPPPQIPSDPHAAARAEAKLRDSEAAAQAGQPHELQLDKTEVNSFLSSNLALAGSAAVANSPGASPGLSGPQDGGAATPGENSGSSAGDSSAPLASQAGSTAPDASGSPSGAVPRLGGSGEREPSLEEVRSSVKDVKVDMDGDLVKAYVVFDFHGKDLSLQLEGHLHAEDGYIHFDPTSGMLGSLPLPQSALDGAVNRLFSSPENREKMRLPADISDLRVADGHLVVNYK